MRRYFLILCVLMTALPALADWDPTKPADNRDLDLWDDDIRANFAAIDAALDIAGTGPAANVAPVYNVLAYGAKGDGSTDDQAAIQAAIDACKAAGGGTVCFPPGIYSIADPLVLNTSYVYGSTTNGAVNLVGANASMTVIRPSDAGEYALTITGGGGW